MSSTNKNGRVSGKIAIVTGAAKGVGRQIAFTLAEQGASVVCADLDGEGAQTAASTIAGRGGKALGIRADITSEVSIAELVNAVVTTFGGIDVVVNNAGLGAPGTVEETTDAEWHQIMDTNVKAIYLLTRAALPYLRQSKGASIVNIGSGLGVRPGEGWAVYGASKGAVVKFTGFLALDHAKDGVRVNCVCPGMIDTDLSRANRQVHAQKRGITLEQATREAAEKYPLQRLGQPIDIANAVLFMASDEASWVTGSTLVVDGGRCAGAH